jgi:hypothetical protein
MPYKNKEDFQAYQKAYRKAHREKESARASAWYANNREKRRADKLAKRYGLTVEEWKSRCERQKNLCAICGKAFVDGDIVVDHCHATGKIRGLLFRRCNAGLGNFDDQAELLLKAHQYLIGQAALQLLG